MQDSSSSNTLERLEQAEQLKLAGNHEEALQILEQLLVEDPTNVSAFEEIADNELSMGNIERAHAAAGQAVKLDPRSYTGYYILGFLFAQEEKWEEGLKELQKANKLKPNNPEILRCLGWTLFNCKKRTQGIVTLERSLNLDEENPLTLCDLGVAYLQTHNFSKARSLFSRTLDLDPENERAQECVRIMERLKHTVKQEKQTTQRAKK